MIILTIRTDKPEAEVGLYDHAAELSYTKWQAHRELAETLHDVIRKELAKQKVSFEELGAIVCYAGPGSFTGLRIGLTVGNALGYGLDIPVVASKGENWRAEGIARVQKGDNDKVAMPEYGADVHITLPKQH